MDRLTVSRSDGRVAIANNDGATPLEQTMKIPLVLSRLAAYEDTGLEPGTFTVSEWISVNDRLPDKPGHYLICTSMNYWHGGCMDINENHKHGPNGTPAGYDGTTMSVLDCYYDVTGDWNRVCNRHVTHWMPLPTPPKEEDAHESR